MMPPDSPLPESRRTVALPIVAGLFSSILPGTGQLLRKQYGRGIFYLAIWAVLVVGSAAMYLWSELYLASSVVLLVFVLCLVAAWDATRPSPPSRKLSKAVFLIFVIPAVVASVYPAQFAWKVWGCRVFSVPSTAMEPTILAGDKIVCDTGYYQRHDVHRGNVALVMTKDGVITVKRIVAVSGDTIEGKPGEIYVNGSIIEEPYVQHLGYPGGLEFLNTFGPVKLDSGEYFAMGDNRDVSLDSRSPDVGKISRHAIQGKPLYIIGGLSSPRNGQPIR